MVLYSLLPQELKGFQGLSELYAPCLANCSKFWDCFLLPEDSPVFSEKSQVRWAYAPQTGRDHPDLWSALALSLNLNSYIRDVLSTCKCGSIMINILVPSPLLLLTDLSNIILQTPELPDASAGCMEQLSYTSQHSGSPSWTFNFSIAFPKLLWFEPPMGSCLEIQVACCFSSLWSL